MYGESWDKATPEQMQNRVTSGYWGKGAYRKRRRMRRGGLDRLYRRRKYRGGGLYSGSGGFWGDLWRSTAGVRGQLGDMARSSNNPLAQAAGWASKALGTGAYETGDSAVKNDIVDGGAGMPVPQFAASSSGGEMGTIQISHREYVADIFGPPTAGVFQNVTYGINPALPETFPWLSQVAANYEEYTIKQLMFTFRSTVTDFVATNGQVGSVIMATQYNANDAPFSSKQDMMEYAGAVSAKVSQEVIAGVECDPAQLSGPPGKYTRSGPTPPDEDVKTYDLGTLNVATSNTPSQFNSQALGELWVSYTVELRKPKFFVTRAQQLLTDVFMGQSLPVSPPTPLSLNDIPWGVGQQNRIGGLLTREYGPSYPLTAGVLYYVFPATFSGNVEVLLNSALAVPNATIRVGAVGPPPATTGAPGIIPIFDLWDQGWQYSSQSWSTPTVNVASWKGHFKIVSPTTAATTVDNVLRIETFVQGYDFRLSVTMYNTGLNYARVDRPIMVNPATELVIDFPQGTGSV